MKFINIRGQASKAAMVGALLLPLIAAGSADAKTYKSSEARHLQTATNATLLTSRKRHSKTLRLQRKLKRLGLYRGRLDGIFGPKTRAGLRKLKKKSRKSARRGSKRKSARKYSGRGRGGLMRILKRVKPKGLPLRLAAAVVTVESGWRVNARGSSGERGLMQLMPATARGLGARGNLYNPTVNMRYGTKYLHYCYRRAKRNVAATIGCYNRGPGKMWQWSGNRITRGYVAKVRRMMGRRRS